MYRRHQFIRCHWSTYAAETYQYWNYNLSTKKWGFKPCLILRFHEDAPIAVRPENVSNRVFVSMGSAPLSGRSAPIALRFSFRFAPLVFKCFHCISNHSNAIVTTKTKDKNTSKTKTKQKRWMDSCRRDRSGPILYHFQERTGALMDRPRNGVGLCFNGVVAKPFRTAIVASLC